MEKRNTSVIVDFLAAVLLLTIVSLIFMIGDRVFFEGRLSGRYYHHSKIYKLKLQAKEERLRNIQLQEEMKLMNYELRETRRQNQQLIDKMQILLTPPPMSTDLKQYLENGGTTALAFFKALYPVSQDRSEPGQLKLMQGKFYVGAPLLFDNGTTTLSTDAIKNLDQSVATLKSLKDLMPEGPEWIVRVEGYADATAVNPKSSLKNNWSVSTARALSVVDYLTQKGLDGSKLIASGHGPYRVEQQAKLFELPHQRFVTLVLEAV